jgi:hypothetical protein
MPAKGNKVLGQHQNPKGESFVQGHVYNMKIKKEKEERMNGWEASSWCGHWRLVSCLQVSLPTHNSHIGMGLGD